MSSRWNRLAPLTGVVYVALMVAALTMASTPDTKASPAKVISFYVDHKHSEGATVFLLAYAAVAIVFFFGVLATYLRRQGATTLATTTFGGSVLMAGGLALAAGSTAALNDHPSRLSAGAAQALNYVSNDLFFIALFAGLAVAVFSAGLAMLRTKAMPTWLGWVTVVIGVAAATGFASWPAFLASGLWTLIVAGLLISRSNTPSEITLPGIPATRVTTEDAAQSRTNA